MAIYILIVADNKIPDGTAGRIDELYESIEIAPNSRLLSAKNETTPKISEKLFPELKDDGKETPVFMLSELGSRFGYQFTEVWEWITKNEGKPND